MQNTINLSIEAIKIHPRNTEFFDDINGAEYETFKDSIREEGILTPLIVASDMTLLSGHQRLKAAQEIGIKSLPVIIREDLGGEDEKLKILLAANFGRSKNDETKQRKIAVEYVKLRGLKNGQKLCDNRRALTQEDIAKELGVSIRTLNEMLEIERKLTPEIKEILDNGAFTKTTASKILVKLSKEEQTELLTVYGKEIIDGVTQKQMQEYSDKIKGLESELKSANSNSSISHDTAELIKERDEAKQKERFEYEKAQKYKREWEALKCRQPEVREIEKIPVDYEDLKLKLRETEKELKHQKFINENRIETDKIVKEFNFELFYDSCREFTGAVSTYQFADERFEKTRRQELQEYLNEIDSVEKLLNIIKNKITGSMNV